jgi:hypothetical protein
MTYQRDPELPNEELQRARRAEMRTSEGWGVFPILLGVLFVVMLGFLLFSGDRTATTGVSDAGPTTNSPGTTKTPVETAPK